MGLRYDALGNNLDVDLIQSYSNNKVSVTSGGIGVPSGGPTIIGTASSGIDLTVPSTDRSYVTSDLVVDIDFGNTDSYTGSGTTVTDLTGTFSPTMVGSPTYNSANAGYFNFDGVNDFLRLNGGGNLMYSTSDATVADTTVETWMKWNTIRNKYFYQVYPTTMTTSFGTPASYLLALVDFGSGALWYAAQNSGGYSSQFQSWTSNINATSSAWHHIAFRISDTALNIMIDGTSLGNTTFTNLHTNTTGSPTRYGMDQIPKNDSDDVDIAAFRYYDKYLTDAEVRSNWFARKGRFGL
jgi:hypothetical protein